MFLFKSSRFGRRVTSAFVMLCIAFVAVSFSGCKPATEITYEQYSIFGTWNGSYPGEVYKITENTFSSDGSYAGASLVVKYTSANSGYIYIKYTEAYCVSHSDISNYSYVYDSDAPDVGKWYCVSFKNLTAKSVSLSGAY